MEILSLHIRTTILQLCLFTIALLFYGCSDDEINNNKNGETENDFRFGLIISDATPPKSFLKSGQTAIESNINQVQILVFENGAYSYSVDGTNIVNSTTTYSATFKARLLSSSQPTTIYIIANANNAIGANPPQVGESTTQVKARLTKAITATPISGNLIMWGTYEFPSGLSATTANSINNIRMLRTVARIDVIAEGLSNFELVSIQAFRVASNMQLIPNLPTTTPSVTDPSIPTGSTYSINTTPIQIGSPFTSSVAQLYLPESVTPTSGNFVSDATCVVVGGRYAGSSTVTYYRLDFNPGTVGNPLGQILRNTRYEFDITYVKREGYATALEAANNISSSMDVRIILWQDYIKYVIFDINNYLGVSESYISLTGDANASYDILTQTDLSSYTISWANSSGEPQGSPSMSNISDDFFNVTRSSDGSTISVVATQDNPDNGTNIPRIRFLLIDGGTLKLLVTIIQHLRSPRPEPGPGGVVWAVTNVDLPGTFADIKDVGKFYQWNRKVAWASKGAVTGWNSTDAAGFLWEEANDPCPTGWRVPTRAELQALLNSTGRSWRIVSEIYNYPGVWFAPTQDEANAATFENPGNGLFFPAGGIRTNTGVLQSAGSNSYYWSSDVNPVGATTDILSIANGTYIIFPNSRAGGAFLRCVHD